MRIIALVGIFLFALIINVEANGRYHPYGGGGRASVRGRKAASPAGSVVGSTGTGRSPPSPGSPGGSTGYSTTIPDQTPVIVDLFKLLDSNRDGTIDQSDLIRCHNKPIISGLTANEIGCLQTSAGGNQLYKSAFNQCVPRSGTVDIAMLNNYAMYDAVKLNSVLGISQQGAVIILNGRLSITPSAVKTFIENTRTAFDANARD